jgi:fatty acid-binding protein DegV
MKKQGINPDIGCYHGLMFAYAKAPSAQDSAEKAIELLKAMEESHRSLNVQAYTTAISACAKAEKWKLANVAINSAIKADV